MFSSQASPPPRKYYLPHHFSSDISTPSSYPFHSLIRVLCYLAAVIFIPRWRQTLRGQALLNHLDFLTFTVEMQGSCRRLWEEIRGRSTLPSSFCSEVRKGLVCGWLSKLECSNRYHDGSAVQQSATLLIFKLVLCFLRIEEWKLSPAQFLVGPVSPWKLHAKLGITVTVASLLLLTHLQLPRRTGEVCWCLTG